jgi:formate hydrogenlyase regulatory protein HycA
MVLPARIPIVHEPEYRTDTIGRYRDGQFYANIHGAGRNTKWYVYLHLFDHDGNHVSSDITMIGEAERLWDGLAEPAYAKRTELLDSLPEREFGDIAIRPFELFFDGVRFALVDESEPERGDWAELYPDGLGFNPPWSGEYST